MTAASVVLAWEISLGGRSYNTDELTLGEIDAIEQISGESWSTVNPWTSIRAAKAFLAVLWIREGRDPNATRDYLDRLTLADIRDSFRPVTGDAPAAAPGGAEGQAAPFDEAST